MPDRLMSIRSAVAAGGLAAVMLLLATPAVTAPEGWTHLSAEEGVPEPSSGSQQTACVIFDADGDGIQDIAVAERTAAPSITLLLREENGWSKQVIDPGAGRPEAGGTAFDVDGDGDLDLIIGGDSGSSELWWYENPSPLFGQPWRRRTIKREGGRAHHDQIVGDFKGVGPPQLVYWNQGARKLFLAEIPSNPGEQTSWRSAEIWSYGPETSMKQEGLSSADIDGDGRLDLLAGNQWFRHVEADRFEATRIAPAAGRIEAGRFDERARLPQVVIAPGDGSGPLMLYTCSGDPREPAAWSGRDLLETTVIRGHTLQVADIDGDGHLDIFTGEMAKWSDRAAEPDHPEARSWILYGDGEGGFRTTLFTAGFDFHEGRVFDADGDGDLDIVSKPYNWRAPRLDIWLQD